MKILALDFETFFSTEYSLTRLTTEEYVRDPQFSAHMLGYWLPDQMAVPADCTPGPIQHDDYFRKLVSESAVLCHHAHFDGLILSHHFGLKPAFWLDTLSMARLVLPRIKSKSLDALAQHFGLGTKTVPYNLFRGLRDLPPDIYAQVAAGCQHDVALTYEIFKRLIPHVPREELKVIDLTVRMFTEPVLRLDRERMGDFLRAEKIRKAKAMLGAGRAIGLPGPATVEDMRLHLARVEAELQSSDKFRTALEALGYECPVKWSEKAPASCAACQGSGVVSWDEPQGATVAAAVERCQECNGTGKVKGGWIPALAKNDAGMKGLLEHDDARVSALAAGRLGVKSTINETRAERLLSADGRGPMPVYLSYAAAKTIRFGGGDKTNWQNFPRGGEIRKSIRAPEGHLLVIGDLSQIEYRLLCWLTGQTDKLDALRAGRDLYCEFASRLYHRTITRDDKAERGTGKQGTLQCGYGAAEKSIKITAASGNYGPPVNMTDLEAKAVKDLYRDLHPCVTTFWRWCDSLLPILASGGTASYRAVLRIADHRIWLPNDTALNYEGLRWASNREIFPEQPDDGQGYAWWEPTREGWSRIWGSKLTADIIQALARVVIISAMVKVAQRLRIVLQVHDELVGIALAAEAPALLEWMLAIMRTPLAWCPDIPLEAEGLVSEIYAK